MGAELSGQHRCATSARLRAQKGGFSTGTRAHVPDPLALVPGSNPGEGQRGKLGTFILNADVVPVNPRKGSRVPSLEHLATRRNRSGMLSIRRGETWKVTQRHARCLVV